MSDEPMPAERPEFREELAGLLMELCRIDTSPDPDISALADREQSVFELIARWLAHRAARSHVTWLPIRGEIGERSVYSTPYYARDESGRALGVAEAYAGRGNLVFGIDGAAAEGERRGLALNGHIDVVKPYYAPTRSGDAIIGRGACDDKGPLVAALGAVSLVAEHLAANDLALERNLTIMFAIDEEIGGNGSLSLALDPELSERYETLVVLECTGSAVHPANRGAVWYRVEGRVPRANLFEAAAYIVGEMESEGRAIKAESGHALFPHRPVQTCHGIIGAFGEHPSRICGRVDFDIVVADAVDGRLSAGEPVLVDLLEAGLRQYVAEYGDKTQVVDHETGRPRVDHHYDLLRNGGGWTVQVHGSTGHMGSILINDGAITKMASMLRSLIEGRGSLETACGGAVNLHLTDWADPSCLLMEGGQGFVPTHTLERVQARLAEAVRRGAERYLGRVGAPAGAASQIVTSFDKLHNAAYACDPGSSAMQDAIDCARASGTWSGAPVRGWDVSCDARLFALERPEVQVLTAGPGELRYAHSDAEQADVSDIARFAAFLARFIMVRCGTVPAAGRTGE